MSGKFLTFVLAGAAPLWAWSAAAQAQQSQCQQPQAQAPTPGKLRSVTWLCQFTSGPRAGTTIDYSRTRGSPLVGAGTPCGDMAGSNGVAVASKRLPSQGRFYQTPGGADVMTTTGQPMAGYTLSCRFTSGPRAGSTGDFQGKLGAVPVQVGAACSDGTSRGVGVAAAPAQP